MTKKKNSRQKRQKDATFAESSDEELNETVNGKRKLCSHLSRAVNFNRMKKALKLDENIETCSGCKNVEAEEDNEVEIWICLQCGYRGCGRTSTNKHAMQHYKTVHSDCHSVVFSIFSGNTWCYECDDDVPSSSSNVVKQCVQFALKLKKNYIPTLNTAQDAVVVENCEPKVSDPFKRPKNVSKTMVKGLRNHGNTCYFNAVMQNLSQTALLQQELEMSADLAYRWEIPIFGNESLIESDKKMSLPRMFPVAHNLLTFLRQMKASSPEKIVSNSALLSEISRKSSQFGGYEQQDSHELLRQLLDAVRQEEIKRQKKAILKAFGLERANPEEVDEETKHKIKAFGSSASHTLVEKVFGGLLISTVLCEECKVPSQVFEPFMDLSLPLFEEKPERNKKHDFDDDDAKYIVKKQKEPLMLSRHQEKKMKVMAKKEKKKAKHSKKNQLDPSLKEEGNTKPSNEEEKEPDNTQENNALEGKEDIDHVQLEIVNQEVESVTNGILEDSKQEMDDLAEDFTKGVRLSDGNLEDRLSDLCLEDIRIKHACLKQDNILDSSEGSSNESPTEDAPQEEKREEEVVHTLTEKQTKEWIVRSLRTLKPRHQPSPLECSVRSCLAHFTKSELLIGRNKYRCQNCTNRKRKATGDKADVIYTNASKQLLIFSPPAILTLHLKRFQQAGMSLRKVNRFVEFPLILDLSSYCSSACLILPHMSSAKEEVLYSLYGVVEHSGRLTSGHYTAFVKTSQRTLNQSFLCRMPLANCDLEELFRQFLRTDSPPPETETFHEEETQWWNISDTHVKEVTEAQVLKCQAYLLFYQRIK